MIPDHPPAGSLNSEAAPTATPNATPEAAPTATPTATPTGTPDASPAATARVRRPSWRRSGAVVAVGLAVALGGCSAVEEQTRDLAADARSDAADRVGEAVASQLDQAREEFGGRVDVDRVCALVADDRLTGAERNRLEVAVELGEALGLPADLTTAGRTVLEATDGATDRVDGLVAACRRAGADPQSGG